MLCWILKTRLLNVISRFGCVEMPTISNIRQLLITIARHLLVGKCLGQLYKMATGVSRLYADFWKSFSVGKLFESLNATPSRVLNAIEEPFDMNAAQAKSFSFLTTYIATASPDDLRRFVTGSSVMIDSPITVTFDTLSGFSRRLIAHTCDATIDLPATYATYPEFQQEMVKLLSSDLAWTMDAQ